MDPIIAKTATVVDVRKWKVTARAPVPRAELQPNVGTAVRNVTVIVAALAHSAAAVNGADPIVMASAATGTVGNLAKVQQLQERRGSR